MGERESEWRDASAGLQMIATAMIIQMMLVGFMLLAILFMIASRKADGMQTVAMLLAVVGLIAQIMMVIGVFRFSHQPAPAPSTGLAQAAGGLGIAGLAISLYVLFTMVQMGSVGPNSDYEAMESAMKAAERLPKIEVLAAAIGFVAMLLMLAAAGLVASHIRRTDIDRKAKTAIAMVLLAAAVFAFVKLGVTPTEPSSLVAMLAMTTIVQVVAFVNILGTVRSLAEALVHAPAELPPARIV